MYCASLQYVFRIQTQKQIFKHQLLKRPTKTQIKIEDTPPPSAFDDEGLFGSSDTERQLPLLPYRKLSNNYSELIKKE